MSDEQCGTCESNGDLEKCLATECDHHDTFVVTQLRSKVNQIFKYLRDAPTLESGEYLEDQKEFQKMCKISWAMEHITDESNLHPGKVQNLNEEVDLCDHSWIFDTDRVAAEKCEFCNKKRDGLYTDTSFQGLPDYGDVMTIEDFTECCNSGGFIDYDGHGCYAVSPCGVTEFDKEPCNDELVMSELRIRPSDVMSKKVDKRFSHVVWFNR